MDDETETRQRGPGGGRDRNEERVKYFLRDRGENGEGKGETES